MFDLLNLHPSVVHFPIALLLLASAAGLLHLYWLPRLELRILTWWPMFIGWIGAGAAVLSGLLGQSGLPPDPPYRSVLNWHIATGIALLIVYGDLLYRKWLYSSKRNRQSKVDAGPAYADLLDDPGKRLWITALLFIGSVLVVASGWNGGRLVYEWGVNVGA